MNIPWDKIIPIVIELIQDCISNQYEHSDTVTAERVLAELKNPGPWIRLRMSQEVRRASGLSGRDWIKNRSEIMSQVYEQGLLATQDQVQMLIDEAIET